LHFNPSLLGPIDEDAIEDRPTRGKERIHPIGGLDGNPESVAPIVELGSPNRWGTGLANPVQETPAMQL